MKQHVMTYIHISADMQYAAVQSYSANQVASHMLNGKAWLH